METRGVREWEYDRSVDVRGHLLNDFFGEGFRASGCPDQNMWVYFFDHRKQIIVFLTLPLRILSRVRDLCCCEFGVLALEKEAWFVDTPDLESGFFFAFPGVGCDGVAHLVSYTGSCRAGTEDYHAQVGELEVGDVEAGEHGSKCNAASSLNVVVEAGD